MSENNKHHFTEEQITKLEEARQLYTHRARDFINRRAAELLKFMQMQASVIMKPNQMELQQKVGELQAYDLEIKRHTDLIQAASVLLAYNEIPHLFDGVKNSKDQVQLAFDTITDLNKDLKKSTLEEVFSVSILSEFANHLIKLYPDTNVFEQASFLRGERRAKRPEDTSNTAWDSTKPAEGEKSSILLS
jgi:hypothetical protein